MGHRGSKSTYYVPPILKHHYVLGGTFAIAGVCCGWGLMYLRIKSFMAGPVGHDGTQMKFAPIMAQPIHITLI